jgi:hypothetical protein
VLSGSGCRRSSSDPPTGGTREMQGLRVLKVCANPLTGVCTKLNRPAQSYFLHYLMKENGTQASGTVRPHGTASLWDGLDRKRRGG